MAHLPLPVRDRVVSIGNGPYLLNKLAKVWRVQKTGFHVQLRIGLISPHKLFTRDFTTKDNPLFKPHSLWQAGVGGP